MKRFMKASIFILFMLLSMIALMACSNALTQAELDSWFTQVSGGNPPAVSVAGKWQDANADPNTPFGWGKGYIEQNGKKIEGAIGNYNIEGRVSGDKVYMAFLSGGSVYYTARLEMKEKGLLRGQYYYAEDRELKEGMPMALEKIGQ